MLSYIINKGLRRMFATNNGEVARTQQENSNKVGFRIIHTREARLLKKVREVTQQH